MYDAIIVGARCAGSPTAMLLARRGYKILLVDKDTFPSDTISTHIIWPHGAELLKRWGLYDRLAATGCPPIARNMVFDVGPFQLVGGPNANNGEGGFCPRRNVLDKLLIDAAAESGVEVRENFTVEDLLWEGDKVVGIRGHGHGGATVEERARIVIGADGRHSLVAKAVDSKEYNTKPPLATFYYSYFSGMHQKDLVFHMRDHSSFGGGPTNDGLSVVIVIWPAEKFHEVRSDIEGNFMRSLDAAPQYAEQVRAAKREEKFYGIGGVPNYFRTRFGEGWALVGDAAYDRDPITGQGISDSFIDAEAITEAIDAGLTGRTNLSTALAEYETARTTRTAPHYEFTCQLATLEPPPPEVMQLFSALRGNQEGINQFFSMMTGALPVPEFFAPENMGRIFSASGSA
jgi:2-polyprenyl-6-methoxyphenol hydroxylase-like FAD-dependent oxidoreductase